VKTRSSIGVLDRIEAELGASGLVMFGGFRPEPADRVPPLPDGRRAAGLLMIGNAGPAAWRAFAAAPEAADGAPDPMDRWCKRVLGGLAASFGGGAHFPSDGPPYPPFVAWAKRAAPVRESPLGMLIHPIYGLWHAYRGALALPEGLPLPPPQPAAHPCDGCRDKPCLTACPVSAFGPQGYRVADCVAHVETAAGADCAGLGCRARRACPVGRVFVYDPPQAAFHMEAFLRARQRRTGGGGSDGR
jgi:hypothetical protein